MTTVMKRIVVDKSTDNAKPHFDLCFYHNINVKENDFSERELEKTLRDTLTRAALSRLIDNGK